MAPDKKIQNTEQIYANNYKQQMQTKKKRQNKILLLFTLLYPLKNLSEDLKTFLNKFSLKPSLLT